MSKFLEQVEDEMVALTGDIPSQNMKLSLKDLLNKEEGWKALPTNTTSESTTDQLKITWNDQVFIVDIKHVPAEDESGEMSDDEISKLSKTIKTVVALPTDKELKKKQGGIAGFGGDKLIKKVRTLRQGVESKLDSIM